MLAHSADGNDWGCSALTRASDERLTEAQVIELGGLRAQIAHDVAQAAGANSQSIMTESARAPGLIHGKPSHIKLELSYLTLYNGECEETRWSFA